MSKGFKIPFSAQADPRAKRPVLLIGEGNCSKTPLTEAEAMEEVRKSPSSEFRAARCGKCFSEDGEAFWHVSWIFDYSFKVGHVPDK